MGEERIVNYTGAGLSLGAEIDVDPATAEWAKGLPEDADLTRALANHVWEKVNEEYKAIEACNVPGAETCRCPPTPSDRSGLRPCPCSERAERRRRRAGVDRPPRYSIR